MQLYQNLYLTYATDRDFVKAKEYAEKTIELTQNLYGTYHISMAAKIF